MVPEIDRAVRDYEAGRISRRELVGTLCAVVTAAVAGASAPSPADEPRSTFRSVGLNHVALRVTDIERSRRFYVEHLGLRVMRESESNCFLACGANHFVALFRASAAGLDHYCYTIDGYEAGAVMERLRAAGLAPERHDDRVYFDDPDGLTVQLSGEWDDYPGGRPAGGGGGR
ncbi:MAG TPA: VOC family protein [Candidatus Polarisedimenticolaceae bacterium]|nr:VOC family protein [Candidatus Polarisedimenticolaceae bacterium]